MDKFFASLMLTVIGSLVFASVSMFQNRSDAANFKKGVEIMLKESNQIKRMPALGSVKKG